MEIQRGLETEIARITGEWSGNFTEYTGNSQRTYKMYLWIDHADSSNSDISGRVRWPTFRDSVVQIAGHRNRNTISWQQIHLISQGMASGSNLTLGGVYEATISENELSGTWTGKNSRKVQGRFSLNKTNPTSSLRSPVGTTDHIQPVARTVVAGSQLDGTDVARVASQCDALIALTEAKLGGEYGYKHLPLCILDAVWSIGVRYSGVQNVIARYCSHFCLDENSSESAQLVSHSIGDLIANIELVGPGSFATDVVCNTQRTSSNNGILKADAVYRFAKVLQSHGIQNVNDMPAFGSNAAMEQELRIIPGQASGKSLKYFFMLAGDFNLIKPDRMTLGFLTAVLQRPVYDDEAQDLIAGACNRLVEKYPMLTPRGLDHEIWKYQRQHGAATA